MKKLRIRGERAFTGVTWLADGPTSSDPQARGLPAAGFAFRGGGGAPTRLRPLPGEGEVPGHPEQVHGDPRHRVLREPAAARGPGLREEPRPLAAARVPAAATQGQSEPPPAPSSPQPATDATRAPACLSCPASSFMMPSTCGQALACPAARSLRPRPSGGWPEPRAETGCVASRGAPRRKAQ